MPRIRAVIFDLGRTLLYFDGDWEDVFGRADRALYRFLEESGYRLDQSLFLNQFRARLSDYYEQRNRDHIEQTSRQILSEQLASMGIVSVPDEVIASGIRRMYRVSQDHWHLEEDAVDTLKSLQSSGYRLGIISNAGDDEDVQTLVDNAGVRPFFDFILSSAAHGMRKPHPLIFKSALDHWGFPPEEVAMVGDNLEADVLGAQLSGMLGVWLTRRADSNAEADLERVKPTAAIQRLSDLPALIENLAKEV